jgi:hypothetical protein
LAYSTATPTDRDVGGLSGNGTKVTTPLPLQGRFRDVGIALATPYRLKVTWPGPTVPGGGAPKKAAIEVALLPV